MQVDHFGWRQFLRQRGADRDRFSVEELVRGDLYCVLFGGSLVRNLRQPRLQRPTGSTAGLRQDASELEDARALFLRRRTDYQDGKRRILLICYEPILRGV